MSCCGVLLGCIRRPRIQLISITFKLTDRLLELHSLTIPLVGITSMLVQGFFFPRFPFSLVVLNLFVKYHLCGDLSIEIINIVLASQAFLVQKLQSLHDYKGHADNFICSLIPGAPFSSAQYTPGQVPTVLSLISISPNVVPPSS